MTAWAIYDSETGALERLVLNDPAELGLDLDGKLVAALLQMPDLSAERWNPDALAFEPYTPPRRLTGLQIIGLYTPAQHARMRRMLFATFPAVYPDGHPQAGQPHPQAGELMDPEGLVQRLADATMAMTGTIAVTDPLHQNGTALYRALGIIETDEEAARIAAGITPEEWAAGVRV